jgi:hypothetical protein
MRRVATVAIVLIATVMGAQFPAWGQLVAPNPNVLITSRGPLTPLGWYGFGSIACAAVSPMIGTIVLGREMTLSKVNRMALSCFLGPVGWLLGPLLFPDPVVTALRRRRKIRRRGVRGRRAAAISTSRRAA